MGRFIRLNENNVIIGIRNGSAIVEGEIESTGELGQIMQEDGTFITPEPNLVETQPTSEEIQTQTLLNTEYLVIMSELTNL